MATTQQQTQSQTAHFLAGGIEVFCAEISDTFGIHLAAITHSPACRTFEEVEKTLEAFSVFITVTISGDLEGEFYILLDKDTALTLASTIVTSSNENQDSDQITTIETQPVHDAAVEIGNLLVASLDSVYGEFFKCQISFSQKLAFVGNIKESTDPFITPDEHQTFYHLPLDMTVGDDTAFKCGFILPETLEQAFTEALSQQNPSEDDSESKDTVGGPVTESIQKIVHSSPNLPGDKAQSLMQIPAEEIMTKEILWAGPDQSVQQAMDQLLDTDATCILIGEQDVLEGIVTWIDLAGAVSIYLQPVFSRWRRPADDATLQIKLNVIMTSPVCTVTPDTPLQTILEEMVRYKLDCMPVIDQDEKVQGVVTTIDIFSKMLSLNSSAD